MEGDRVVRWERFLPRSFLTVLLVEKDESTRDIVSALLGKCGYRVVLASDGLKAWELIREKQEEVDLVLAEVELPHMSGFALLSLMMDQENCKDIPVILMSSHDSLNVVFKCLLKGAADFLVKPIRKNELRNLWQHVWRRYISNGEFHGTDANPGINLAERECKDNDSDSSQSNGNIASVDRKGEVSDKASETQNSCTRQEMEVESSCVQILQEKSQMNLRSILKKGDPIHDQAGKSTSLFPEVTSWNPAVDVTVNHQYSTPKGFIENGETLGQCRQANPNDIADLLGAMDNKRGSIPTNDTICTTVDNISKDSGFPLHDKYQLELSLRRYQPDIFDGSNGCHMLSHSSSSAFSRYDSRSMMSHFPPTECGIGKNGLEYQCQFQLDQDTSGPTCSQLSRDLDSTMISSPSQDHKAVQYLQPGSIPFPVPVGQFDNSFAEFDFSLQPLVPRRLGPPPWSTKPTKAIPIYSSNQSGPKILESIKSGHSHDRSGNIENYQAENLGTFEYTENQRHLATNTYQSGSSSICNGNSNVNSTGVGSVCNGYGDNLVAQKNVKTGGEITSDDRILIQGGMKLIDSHRSIEREAALTKYRLKKKERCFEKKVRYHSRRRLAEQRPRVRGQFVRQGQGQAVHKKSIQVDSYQRETMAT